MKILSTLVLAFLTFSACEKTVVTQKPTPTVAVDAGVKAPEPTTSEVKSTTEQSVPTMIKQEAPKPVTPEQDKVLEPKPVGKADQVVQTTKAKK